MCYNIVEPFVYYWYFDWVKLIEMEGVQVTKTEWDIELAPGIMDLDICLIEEPTILSNGS